MRNFIIKKLNCKEGTSGSITFICCVGALMVVFYILVMAFTPFMLKGEVQAYTKTLVRQIEIHGAIDSEIEEFADELAVIYGFEPKVTYDADFIATTKNIQIRDKFKVTVKTDSEIVLLNGTFFDPITVTIPLDDEKVGISERLWK